MAEEMLQNQVDEIRELFASKLHARGRSFQAQVRKAGRQLPRRQRQNAKIISDAVDIAENPKLARMLDEHETSKALNSLTEYLKSIDPKDRLKGRILSVLGSISAALIVTFIVVVYVLVKRDLL